MRELQAAGYKNAWVAYTGSDRKAMTDGDGNVKIFKGEAAAKSAVTRFLKEAGIQWEKVTVPNPHYKPAVVG